MIHGKHNTRPNGTTRTTTNVLFVEYQFPTVKHTVQKIVNGHIMPKIKNL